MPERADWAKLSAGWTKRIRERIAELERLEAVSPSASGAAVSRWIGVSSQIPATGSRAKVRGRGCG